MGGRIDLELKDILVAAKNCTISANEAADRLDIATPSFVSLHQLCYGDKFLKPKHHWVLDLAAQIRRDQMALDAFIIERQHLMVKGVAEPVRNTSTYEKSVLKRLVQVMLQVGKVPQGDTGLIGRTSKLDEAPQVLIGEKAMIHSFMVSTQDVVMRGLQAATVVACAVDEGELFFFVTPMTQVEEVTTFARKYRPTARLAVWQAAQVQQCLAWRVFADGLVLAVTR